MSFVFYRFLLHRKNTHEIEFLQIGGSLGLGFTNVSTQTEFFFLALFDLNREMKSRTE